MSGRAGECPLSWAHVPRRTTMSIIDSLQHWFAAYAQGASGCSS